MELRTCLDLRYLSFLRTLYVSASTCRVPRSQHPGSNLGVLYRVPAALLHPPDNLAGGDQRGPMGDRRGFVTPRSGTARGGPRYGHP